MPDSSIILLPSTPDNYTIGSVFSNYFIISSETEMMKAGNVVWDFSNVVRIHPFLVALLALYISVSDKHIECININPDVESFLSNASFWGPSNFTSLNLDELRSKNHVPFCNFSADDDASQQLVENIIMLQSGADKSIATPLAYFLGELICNIDQHSGTEKVLFYSQYQKQENTIYICIADKGFGIYGNYVRAGKFLGQIGNDDAAALKMANEGYSSKNLPSAENRGFGISTTKNMLVNGLLGSFYMMSGNAFVISNPHNNDSYLELPKGIEWQGTVVMLQIPCRAPANFSFYDFV